MYPIRVFGYAFMVLVFSLPFLVRPTMPRVDEVLPILTVVGSVSLVTIATFLVWERWDLSLVGTQWIEDQESKPRNVLLLIMGLCGVSYLSPVALSIRYALDQRGRIPLTSVYHTIFLITLTVWALIGLLSFLLSAIPISTTAFKLLNSGFAESQDREGAVRRVAIMFAAVLILEQILNRLLIHTSAIRPTIIFLLIGTCFIPFSVASFYAFIVVWWDSVRAGASK